MVSSRGNRVNAVRGEEFESAARAFEISSFDPYGKLDVVYVDVDGVVEGAVDEGGCTREFCTLLIHQIQNNCTTTVLRVLRATKPWPSTVLVRL